MEVVSISSQIERLSNLTDGVTKQILKSLVEKKEKLEQIKGKEKKIRVLVLFSFAVLCLYVFIFLKTIGFSTFGAFFAFLFDHSYHLVMVLIIISLYFYLLQTRKKAEKVEKEFHDLRCEVIQKSPSLWPTPEKWEARQDVFHLMKKEYGINLYYENK